MRYYGHANGALSKFPADSTEEVLSEPTHSFEVDEAVRLGSVEKAILLKEIRRMAVYKARAGKEPWVFYSGKMLSEKFPYLPQRSVERWMRELEEAGELVTSIRNKMRYDKTKSYTLPQFVSIVAQNGEWIAQNGEPIPPLTTPSTNSSANAPLRIEDETPKKQSKAKDNHQKSYDSLIDWLKGLTGAPMPFKGKQYAHLAAARVAGITPSQLKRRAEELWNEPFYQEKGLDWGKVVSNFNGK